MMKELAFDPVPLGPRCTEGNIESLSARAVPSSLQFGILQRHDVPNRSNEQIRKKLPLWTAQRLWG